MVVSPQSPVKKQVFYLVLVWRQLVEVQLISKTNADRKRRKKLKQKTITAGFSKYWCLEELQKQLGVGVVRGHIC